MGFINKNIIAIMGPSGAGKTTLGDILSSRQEIAIPRHCTTRSQRGDDRNDFYRYLTHDEYRELLEEEQFLISSGDGPVVRKEYGNFYGVLINDCLNAWQKSNVIILFVSYKDIESLIALKEKQIDVDIVNLTFVDIEKGVASRLINSPTREHSQKEINNRIQCALSDTEKYSKALTLYAKTIVYTDILDIEQTYNKVCTDLGFKRR